MRLVSPLIGVALCAGCAHTVTNEQRLEGMTDVTVNSTEGAAELRCRDSSPEIQIARDVTQKKSERVARYRSAVADAKGNSERFEDAFRKDPDLLYGPKGDDWKHRQAFCLELSSTLQKEQTRVEGESEREAPAAVAVKPVEKKEKDEPAPVKKSKKSDKTDKSDQAETAVASADDAFGDDADSLRSAYKKKAKNAKAKGKSKSKKKHVLAAR
jgi:hypothetical protein